MIILFSDLSMEEVGATGALGLLDTQEMWQGVAGEKQEADQGAQTFTLPPDQEVAMLLDQPPIISFQQPVIILLLFIIVCLPITGLMNSSDQS